MLSNEGQSSQTEALNEFNSTMETQQQLIIKDSLSVSVFYHLMFLAVVNRSEELPLERNQI